MKHFYITTPPAVAMASLLAIGLLSGCGKQSGDETAVQSQMEEETAETKQGALLSNASEPGAATTVGDADDKIDNATEAAPEAIAENATVVDWPATEGGDFPTLREGSNPWTCLPDDPKTPGNDPICADRNSMRWFQAYMEKRQPQLAQPGIAYMLQGGATASNTDPFATAPAPGEDWMDAAAHIMLFPAGDLDPEDFGADPTMGGPWIMWSGTPFEHLMIPVE